MRHRVTQLSLAAILAVLAVYSAGAFTGPRRALLLSDNGALVCSGGAVSSDGAGNTVIKFVASGVLSCSQPVIAKALACAGGGGGASGGGAANCQTSGSLTIPAGSTTITVGLGGAAAAGGSGTAGTAGGASSIGSLLVANATAGGGGYAGATVTAGGGCGANANCTGSAGSQGYAGGSNSSYGTNYPAAGGAGAGGNGGSVVNITNGGAGGTGLTSAITGTSVCYGGGGGGGIYFQNGSGIAGTAACGGSNGAIQAAYAAAGVNGLGGGGGGSGASGLGGNGGDGVVIISCPQSTCGKPSGTVASYTGQVATRVFVPTALQASTTGWNSQTCHYARTTIVNPQIVDGNWYAAAGTGEANQGGTKLITRAIVYNGTVTRVTWSSANSYTIPNGGQVVSDPIPVTIPNGALFCECMYQVNSVGVVWTAGTGSRVLSGYLPEAINNSGSDQTASCGSVTNSGGYTAIISPLAIVASTTQPSVGTIGSSRMAGGGDTQDATGNAGYARLFGDYFAYIDASVPGDTTAAVSGSGGAKRRALVAAYASHLWLDPGLNDLNSGTLPSVVEADLIAMASAWSRGLKKVIMNDEAAFTVTTDSCATNVNQTVESWEANRVSLNAWIHGLTGYNQIAYPNAFDGNGTNFQYWNNPVVGGRQWSPDCVHENQATLLAMKASTSVFNPDAISLP
jgi:hypothetical protein